MKRLIGLSAFLSVLLVVACLSFCISCAGPTVPTTQPTLQSAALTIGEKIALSLAQAELNKALTNLTVTRPQYDAAEAILMKLNLDLQASNGTLTQAQVDDLFNTAIAQVVLIYPLPIQPIQPLPAGQFPGKK